MKSWPTKLFIEIIDTLYIMFGAIVIVAVYLYSSASDGLMGILTSPWTEILGVIISFIVLLLPYYAILKYNKKFNKDA